MANRQHIQYDDFELDSEVKREVLNFWKENGYVTVENILEPETVEQLKGFIDKVWEKERPLPTTHPVMPHERYEELVELSRNERIVHLSEYLLEAPAKLMGSIMWFRGPGSPGAKCHQDNYYLHTSPPGGQLLAWIAIDEANVENGCLYVYPGSHREGPLPVKKHWVNFFRFFTSIVRSLIHKREAVGLQFNEAIVPKGYQKTHVEVSPGSIVFTHGSLLHGSDNNRSRHSRRSLGLGYLAQGATIKSGPIARRTTTRVPVLN